MADRHSPTLLPIASVAGGTGDSFSDGSVEARALTGVDPVRPLDSGAKRVCTDVPERIDLLLRGEAALVYQHLRGRLGTLFDDAGN